MQSEARTSTPRRTARTTSQRGSWKCAGESVGLGTPREHLKGLPPDRSPSPFLRCLSRIFSRPRISLVTSLGDMMLLRGGGHEPTQETSEVSRQHLDDA